MGSDGAYETMMDCSGEDQRQVTRPTDRPTLNDFYRMIFKLLLFLKIPADVSRAIPLGILIVKS
jgi:hypothetical protein